MLDWKQIDTVLLDMDGTLLDLHFDNYFWQQLVPQKFAERNGLTIEMAKQQLVPQFKSLEGSLQWYCLDYWSTALGLDIVQLKQEISHLIRALPHVLDFLHRLKTSPRKVLLVTNAHRDSLSLKMQKTALQTFFDGMVSSHDFGYPKEHPYFWQQLHQLHPFDKTNTVMVDDSLAVLGAAKQFGIAHLVAISQPDSQQPQRHITDFPAITDFRALLDAL
jgi:5'-nucleotidase